MNSNDAPNRALQYDEEGHQLEHSRLIAAMRESEAAVQAGEVQDFKTAFDLVRKDLGL
ncbi:MAG: hypothetical protein QOJ65_2794 [Fimbriimonadaceae bacterium]|jgi:hypothetical protein|nr:hypothetical protein [Fimbriimonadaceae bacterium]